MNFDIRYVTAYAYDAEVTDNLNSLRVRPATTSNQRCDEFTVRVDPEARMTRHTDYFGTEVIEFGIVRAHAELTIDVRARVATAPPPDPPDLAWAELERDAYAEAAGEFILDTNPGLEVSDIEELLAASRARSPLTTVQLLCELIPDRYAYTAGVTHEATTVKEFLQTGAGVCQDYVHLGVLLLRRHGIAARYVSGYLWSAKDGGGDASVEVETHAWLEALLPTVEGRGEPVWVGADPTNRCMAGERHVKIGHGRYYADVPPIKGVYQGSATAELEAKVLMTRLDPQASARA